MDVILLERVGSLGNLGDTVRVRDGYARNFLLPRKKALRATKENRERFERDRDRIEAENAARRAEVAASAEALEGVQVVVIRQASERGQLYGSVTARDVAQALTESAGGIDRRQVRLDHAIKIVGVHAVSVALHPEVEVEVTVNVARSEDEAKSQAERHARGEEVLGVPGEEDEEEGAVLADAEEIFDDPEQARAEAEADAAAEDAAQAEAGGIPDSADGTPDAADGAPGEKVAEDGGAPADPDGDGGDETAAPA